MYDCTAEARCSVKKQQKKQESRRLDRMRIADGGAEKFRKTGQGSGESSGNRRKIQSAQSRQNTGFPIRVHAFQSHGDDPSERQDMEQG